MHQFLMTLDGREEMVMRYSWNMAVTAYLNGTAEIITPSIQAILDEFEDEVMVMHPELNDDPLFIRMIQATSFIFDFIRKHYLEMLSQEVKLDELMFYAYDKSTATLILQHVKGF